MIYGRRKGARSWQEHFDSILRSGGSTAARFHSGIALRVPDTLLRA